MFLILSIGMERFETVIRRHIKCHNTTCYCVLPCHSNRRLNETFWLGDSFSSPSPLFPFSQWPPFCRSCLVEVGSHTHAHAHTHSSCTFGASGWISVLSCSSLCMTPISPALTDAMPWKKKRDCKSGMSYESVPLNDQNAIEVDPAALEAQPDTAISFESPFNFGPERVPEELEDRYRSIFTYNHAKENLVARKCSSLCVCCRHVDSKKNFSALTKAQFSSIYSGWISFQG